MTFRKIVLLFFQLLAIWTVSEGQTGNLFLTHYRPENHLNGFHCMNIAQGPENIMYFGGPGGITSFDGWKSKKINTSAASFSLKYDSVTNTLYAGCRNSFGYIEKDEYGDDVYRKLNHDSLKVGDVHQVLVNDTLVWFFSDNYAIRFHKPSKKVLSVMSLPGKNFSGAFIYKSRVYVNIEEKGLFVFYKGQFSRTNISQSSDKHILFAVPFGGKIILGLNNNKFYIFNGHSLKHYPVEADELLEHCLIVDAIKLSDHKIALATASAGCLIVNLNTRKTIHRINYFRGLPDNEIFALGLDNNGGLWLAHDRGFSRADSRVPFRIFSHYEGLQGNILAVIEHQNTIYVATNNGLFVLSRKEYSSQVSTAKKYSRRYSEYYSRRNKIYRYAKKNNHVNTRIYYRYEKINGINGKCRNLFIVRNKLFFATNTGLYYITGKKSKSVVKDIYINSVAWNKEGHIVLGLREGIYHVNSKQDLWSGGEIKSLYFNGGSLWFVADDKIYQTGIKKRKLEIIHSFPMPGNLAGESDIRKIKNRLFLFTPSGIYQIYTDSSIIKPSDAIINFSEDYLTDQPDISWIKSNKGWTGYWGNGKDSIYNPYLILNNNIENIHVTKEKHLWLINSENELIRVVQDVDQRYKEYFDINLTGIKSDKGGRFSILKSRIPHNSKGLTFEFNAPYYLSPENTMIQYRLSGVMSEWSEWTPGSQLNFPFLPSGDHTLEIRAKNGLGDITNLKKVEFRINPPYWKTTWFYLLEIIFFGSLIFLSIILNTNRKNIFLTKALTFLTLIILVEFLDEVIKSSWGVQDFESPVISFALDVTLAMLISPIEKLLEIILLKKRRQLIHIYIQYRKFSKHANESWPIMIKNVQKFRKPLG